MKKLLMIVIGIQILNAAVPQKMPETQIKRVADLNKTGVLDEKTAFAQYKTEIKQSEIENQKIPVKDNSIFRVMTYNVHFWRNPEDKMGAMNSMIEAIATVNPDIVILQEVSPNEGFAQGKHFEHSTAFNKLQSIGFTHFSACNTVKSGWFGNIIAGKQELFNIQQFSFGGQKENQSEKRCYSFAKTRLSTGEDLYMYGTHLEVRDDGTIRLAQVSEIIQRIHWALPNSNVLLAADFNATRSSSAIKTLQQSGFKDCFTYMGWPHPTFTSWAGTEIDFIFLSPNWHLPIAGCYVYFNSASDHLPVIMDIALDSLLQIPNVPLQASGGDQKIKTDTNYLKELLQTLQKDLICLVQLINT